LSLDLSTSVDFGTLNWRAAARTETFPRRRAATACRRRSGVGTRFALQGAEGSEEGRSVERRKQELIKLHTTPIAGSEE